MSSYGYTLEEFLNLTYPQIKRLFRQLMKWPTANILAASIANSLGGDDELEKFASKAGAVAVVEESDKFLESLGIKQKAEG